MSSGIEKQPGPDHPITIERCTGRIVARVGGHTIADTRRALVLREAHYPPVWYIPRDDVDGRLLERSTRSTYCPYKGDCAYYGLAVGGDRIADAAWSYEAPYAAVAAIRGHLAFYPDRLDFLGPPEA